MLNGDKNSDRFSFRKMRFLSFWWMSHLGKVVTEEAMNSKAVQDFLKSNPKFDLVIGDCFLTEGMLGGFVHRFGAPLIGLTSGIANLWSNEMVSKPALL